MSYPKRDTPNLQNCPPPVTDSSVRESFAKDKVLDLNYETVEERLTAMFELKSEHGGKRIGCCDKEQWEFGGHVTLGRLWTSIFVCLSCKKVAFVVLLKEAFYRTEDIGYGLALFGTIYEEGKIQFELGYRAVRVANGTLERITVSDIAASMLPTLKNHVESELALGLLQLISRRQLQFSDFCNSPLFPLRDLKTKCKESGCDGVVVVSRDPANLTLNVDMIYCIKCGKRYVLDTQGLTGKELEQKLYGL